MGGTPLPPFTDKIFGKKGVTDLGGTPPSPFTDKIRKVVFEVLPYSGLQNSCKCLAAEILCLAKCVNRDILPTCVKARKSRHFAQMPQSAYTATFRHDA